eukprot:m.162593 g.162593  ORF g.162593 m.162593 type:complete len:955 (-) comp12215_c0_seq1:449-3313(-)
MRVWARLHPAIRVPTLLWIGLLRSPVARAQGGVSVGADAISHCVSQGLFFDPARLACGSCGSNQQVTASGDACECDANSIVTSTTVREPRGAVVISCTACAAGEQVSFDGLSCIPCPGGVCTCAAGEVNRTRGASGTLATSECLTCDAGFGQGGNERCLPCAYANMAAGCATCPTGTTLQGLDCIDDTITISPPASTAFLVPFAGVGSGTVDSTLFRQRLPGAYIHCLDTLGTNRTACQQLANLCVLQLYSDTLGSQTACTLYKQIVALNTTTRHGFPGWPLVLPWLFYDTDAFPAASSDIQLTGTFDHAAARSGTEVSQLQFVVHVYYLNGTFAGVQPVTSQFELCLQVPPRWGLAWTYFGTSFSRSCSLQLNNSALFDSNLETAEPLFYEPYLVDYSATTGSELLYPIPVKIDGSNTFVRRYFLFDNVTAAGQTPHAVRVATSVSLLVKMRSGGDGKIYPPVLTVSYTTHDGTNPTALESTFSTTYTDDHDDFGPTLEVVVTVMGLVSAILAYIRSRSDRERDRRDDGGLRLLTSFVYEWTRYFSTSLYAILGLTGLVFLTMSNRDSAAYTTPPNNDQDDEFETWLIVAASFKIMQACYTVFEQSGYDYFLIDWEDESASKSAGQREASIWRTLFVANELQELSTLRKVPYQFLVTAVLFFWYVADADDLALQNPQSDAHDYRGEDNSILRFAVAAMLFTSLYVGMWLYNKVIHVRLISDPFGSFQDLCSLSNISVIVLTHDCRGFYLHGMSPHGPAEVGLIKMTQQLEEESEDLGRRRGLVENSDDQVFEIHIQESVRREYNTLLDDVRQATRQGGRGTSWKVDPGSIDQYSKLNKFFKAYLTHAYNDKDWIVREKGNLERWVSMTPAVDETAIFFPDQYGGMSEVFFLGQEGAIFIFEFLVFALVDWYAHNFVGAATATVVCTTVIHWTRLSLGKDNLAKKTLVNKCFLI